MFMKWRIMRIRGHSMSPVLQHGDIAISSRNILRERICIGGIFEINHDDLGPIVKRVIELRSNLVLVGGVSSISTEVNQLGWIDLSRVVSHLVWRISCDGIARI